MIDLNHLYSLNLWDVPLPALRGMAARVAARDTHEARVHARRINRNILLRERGITQVEASAAAAQEIETWPWAVAR